MSCPDERIPTGSADIAALPRYEREREAGGIPLRLAAVTSTLERPDMIDALQDFAGSLPAYLQWLGVMLVAAIPFVESYFGSVVGVLIGLPPAVAIGVAVIGNVVSMLVFVLTAHGVRSKVVAGKQQAPEESPRREKLRRAFDKYGVAGVSIVGQTILPSQITSAAMVSFGASRNAVIFWQIVSIVLWGVVFGVLATLGVSLVR
ncbi:hypothetical protein GCM10010196_18000 [Agromyces mediolanus]|uniref:Small multidrug efflux protein n=2 Tax=Agromyces mediolanus TaxID=41986 RepID=A0A918FDA6_AGRME|nr:hypothetical protein GCM10010196_18000 [Agromyces mediolanus]GLJ70940.1 hypothetical protein GCM10017583_01950 [Agromyces mediolanus]